MWMVCVTFASSSRENHWRYCAQAVLSVLPARKTAVWRHTVQKHHGVVCTPLIMVMSSNRGRTEFYEAHQLV